MSTANPAKSRAALGEAVDQIDEKEEGVHHAGEHEEDEEGRHRARDDALAVTGDEVEARNDGDARELDEGDKPGRADSHDIRQGELERDDGDDDEGDPDEGRPEGATLLRGET